MLCLREIFRIWRGNLKSITLPHLLLKYYSYMRKILRVMHSRVLLRPYAELPGDFLPPHLREQLPLIMSQTVLICFEKVVHHNPKEFLLQLGLEDLDCSRRRKKPRIFKIKTKKRTGTKEISGTDWTRKGGYPKYIELWDARKSSLIVCDARRDSVTAGGDSVPPAETPKHPEEIPKHSEAR